jgi:hypothetical protein
MLTYAGDIPRVRVAEVVSAAPQAHVQTLEYLYLRRAGMLTYADVC